MYIHAPQKVDPKAAPQTESFAFVFQNVIFVPEKGIMLTADECVECVVRDGSKFFHWKKMKSNSKTVPSFFS